MTTPDLLVSPIEYLAPEKLLDGLTGEQAAARIGGAPHSIVEILAHLDFWQRWFVDRCEGRATRPPAHAAEGWPAVGAADWSRVHESFLAGLARLASLQPPASRRVEPAIEFPAMATYTIEHAIVHVALHNAHHLGQVVTLRQLQGTWPPPAGSWTW